uniref:VGCC_alpha2 domain-containing protein n=2 Tax=Macrostomum lignano TaxID=282301 RepID=A0A1I8ICQ4_9PLAT
LSIALPAENAGYVAFDSGIRPAFEQLDGSLWTVSMADGLAAKATYPSPYAAYLVPTDTPYCSEYYTPPPPSPTLSSTGSANDSNSTADPPPPLPSPPPTAPAFDEHHERELTERLRLAPDNLGNLLQTLALNESACNPHWSASLAADLVLLDSFFKSHAMDPPKPWVASVAASGPGGVTGVFPPGEAAQYRAWRDGWSAGHYRRAAQMPDMLFATVPCMSESTYNLSTVVSTAAPQATRTTTAAADIFGLSSVNSSWPTSPTLGPGPLDVTLYQAVTVKDFSIAVLGVTLSGRWLAETVFTGPFADLCSPDGDNHTCYLVEDGGYIVSANDGSTETVGHFLGTVDKPLMRHLVFNLSVFASVQEYDFQGICRNDLPADPHFSKAAPAGPGPNRLALAVAAAASLLALRTGQQQPEFQLLPRQPLLMTAMATLTLPSLTEGNVLPKGPTFDCIKKGYRYYRDFSVVPPDSSTDELGRSIRLAGLPGTNLLLVAVQKLPGGLRHPDLGRRHSTGFDDYDKLLRDPTRHHGPDVCSQDYRYRERPATCYRSHPKEDRECSPASVISANVALTAVSVLTAVAVLHQLIDRFA